MAAERTVSGIHHDKSALQPSDNGVENEARAGGAQKVGRTDYLAPPCLLTDENGKRLPSSEQREEREIL